MAKVQDAIIAGRIYEYIGFMVEKNGSLTIEWIDVFNEPMLLNMELPSNIEQSSMEEFIDVHFSELSAAYYK